MNEYTNQQKVSKADGEYISRYALPVINDALAHMCTNKSPITSAALLSAAEDIDLNRKMIPVGDCSRSVVESAAWKGVQASVLAGTPVLKDELENVERVKSMSYKLSLGEDRNMPAGKLKNNENYLFADFSKNAMSMETAKQLDNLARDTKVRSATKSMFSGDKINITENRAVLHTALRNRNPHSIIMVDGVDVMPSVRAVLNKMKVFTSNIHEGKLCGFSGKKIRYVVNIGIGGSDLGPVMVTQALGHFHRGDIIPYFISNIDGTNTTQTLKNIDLETTLFIVVSKTFTTQETLINATSAKEALLKHYAGIGVVSNGGDAIVAKHFAAVSNNVKKAQEFGIHEGNMFENWDWVGGRYSVWSAVGLSISLTVGYDNFEEFLEGAYIMDQHFINEELTSFHNIPTALALVGILHNNFLHAETYAVLPYSHYLGRLPSYLQQLDMESNGKGAIVVGKGKRQGGQEEGELLSSRPAAGTQTGPIVFGEVCTNGQHSFFQHIHQGTKAIPCDFIGVARTHDLIGDHHKILMSNFFAQTEALMRGKTKEEAYNELISKGLSVEDAKSKAPHSTFPGNRSSNSILLRALTPRSLGALVAMYEHKVFVQGVIWGINSFDQFGVELGKVLAKGILPELKCDRIVTSHDASTNGLINMFNCEVDESFSHL
eukprot:Tbor_TRINITY_DN5356_c3_g1::TRINITY_DN5356_c3_g1_i1::g.4286::m.4286/K01810/GPI, pgi; glucose-6-phosphate isomerase